MNLGQTFWPNIPRIQHESQNNKVEEKDVNMKVELKILEFFCKYSILQNMKLNEFH